MLCVCGTDAHFAVYVNIFLSEFGGKEKQRNRKRTDIWALKSFQDHSFIKMEDARDFY